MTVQPQGLVVGVRHDVLGPGGDADGQVDGCDTELAGEDLGAACDLAQGLAGDPERSSLTHEAGQVGDAAGVQLGDS